MFAGLPTNTLASLQRVLNAAARLPVGTDAENSIGDVMRSLYWLPIADQTRFKLCLVMHAVNNGASPTYIADTTTPMSSLPGHRRLCSDVTN